MKHFDINFLGGKSRYRHGRAGETFAFAYLLAVGGVACALALATAIYVQIQERSNLTQLADSLSQRLVAKRPGPAKQIPERSPAKIDALNSAINRLNIPWRDLFDSIEQATPKDIALISLEPDGAKRTLVLIGEASNPKSMLDYLGKLEAQALFSSVLMVKHEINKQDPNSPYRFQFEARWKEPAP